MPRDLQGHLEELEGSEGSEGSLERLLERLPKGSPSSRCPLGQETLRHALREPYCAAVPWSSVTGVQLSGRWLVRVSVIVMFDV